ncbi:MAG: hypothetical protein E7335_03090 [Clostridiales bacterium]|nr:hypothetical protein [Clostridiales bacterium]
MRRSMRRRQRRSGSDNGSFWLCFSDLMSTLVLVLILIMFYSLYAHFDAMEEATARIISQETALSEKEDALAAQNDELESSRLALIEQQRELNAALEELEKAQLELAASQLSAEEKEELLSALQLKLEEQQSQIASQQSLMAQQEAQLEDLIGVRSKIIVELAGALNAANVQVNTDQKTGAIQLSSEVLFDVGQSVLSDLGKGFLQKFIPVYMEVLLSAEYDDSVSEIIIEGHTDSTGTYIENMALSQNRARAVFAYILSDEFVQLTPGQKEELRKMVTVNGRSFSDPVLDENGAEDMAASRRVEFKFRLHDESMIEQMRELLKSFE